MTQLLLVTRSRFTRRARLEAENLLLRQQLVVLRRKSPKRLRLWNIDRLLLVWLYRLYPALLDAIIIVQPETVLRHCVRLSPGSIPSVPQRANHGGLNGGARWIRTLGPAGWRTLRSRSRARCWCAACRARRLIHHRATPVDGPFVARDEHELIGRTIV
jgi:hypothetical protein